MTRPDLDALEKLADEATLPMSVKTIRMHKKAVREFRIFANPWKIKALIAELKEARGHLEAMTACSSDYLASGSELARSCKEGMWGELLASARAFLARNGGSQ